MGGYASFFFLFSFLFFPFLMSEAMSMCSSLVFFFFFFPFALYSLLAMAGEETSRYVDASVE